MDRAAWVVAGTSIALNLGAVGALLAIRRPRNPIGWLLLLQSWLMAAGLSSVPVLPIDWAAPLLLTVLLLPHGRLPSPRWRILAVVILVTAAAQILGAVLGVRIGVPPRWDRLELVLIAGILLGASAVFVRFRRATRTERAQLRLLVLAGSLLGVSSLVGALFGVLPIVIAIAFPLVPWAVAAAVLHYRLHDVDRLVSRTVTYATLAVALGALYAAIVVGFQLFVGADDVPVAVDAVATLAAVAWFRPLRARLRTISDLRFNRARYDAARVIDEFGSHLRTQVDLAAVETELVRAARYALRPSSASLWLTDPERQSAGPSPTVARRGAVEQP